MWVVVYSFGLVALFESLKGFQVDLRVKNLLWSGLFGGVWVFMIHFIQAMTNDLSNFQLPRDLWHTWLEELNTHTHTKGNGQDHVTFFTKSNRNPWESNSGSREREAWQYDI